MILFQLQCFKNAQFLDIMFLALIIFNPIIFSQLLPVKMSNDKSLLNLLIHIFILQLATYYLYIYCLQLPDLPYWNLVKQTCQVCITFCKHINWEMMDLRQKKIYFFHGWRHKQKICTFVRKHGPKNSSKFISDTESLNLTEIYKCICV